MKKIVVVGSLNMDCVVETPSMPKPGETITGKSVSQVPGGKGANQAYAIGKLGGDVQMIGAVGNDSCGMALKKSLESVGVKTDGLAILDGETTGQAFITVDGQGENSIIIIAGTNGLVTRELIDQNRRLIEESDIVIMQLEIPLEVVEYVKELAVSLGKLVIVDPAPAVEGIPDHFWKGIDFIKPNETELAILTGQERKNREELEEGARQMLAKGVKGVLVSLGGDGCLLVREEESRFFPANKVKAVDHCGRRLFYRRVRAGVKPGKKLRGGHRLRAEGVSYRSHQKRSPDFHSHKRRSGSGIREREEHYAETDH